MEGKFEMVRYLEIFLYLAYFVLCLDLSQGASIDGLAGRLIARPTDASTTKPPTATTIIIGPTVSIPNSTLQPASPLGFSKSTVGPNPALINARVPNSFDNSTDFFFITLAPIFDAVDGDKILISTNGSHMDIRKIFTDPHDPERTELVSREILTVEDAIIKYNISSVDEGSEETFTEPTITNLPTIMPASSAATSIIPPSLPVGSSSSSTPVPTTTTTSQSSSPTTKTTTASTTPYILTTKPTTTVKAVPIPIQPKSTIPQAQPIPIKWDLLDYDGGTGQGANGVTNDLIVILTVGNETDGISNIAITSDTTTETSSTVITTTTVPPPKVYFLSFSVTRGINYTDELGDPNSLLHAQYSRIFKQSVDNIYDKRYGPDYVESKEVSFSKGSVVVQVLLQLPSDSKVNQKELESEFLKGLVNQTLNGTNYVVDPVTIQVSDKSSAKYRRIRKEYYPAWKATAIVVGLLSFFLLLAVLLVLLLALKRTKEEFSKNPITGLSYKRHSGLPNRYYASGDDGNPVIKHSTPAVSGFSPNVMGRMTGPKKSNGNYSPNLSSATKAKSPKATLHSYTSGPNIKYQPPVKRLTGDDIQVLANDNVEVSSTKGHEAGNTYDEATHKPDPPKSGEKLKEPVSGLEQIYMNVPKSVKGGGAGGANNSKSSNATLDKNVKESAKKSLSQKSIKYKKGPSSTDEDSSPNLSSISPISSGIFKRNFEGDKSNVGTNASPRVDP